MRNIVWILLASLLVFVGCCGDDDEHFIPGPGGGGNTAVITDTTANTAPSGAGYSIPADTTVTSSSVSNGSVTFGFGDCSTAALGAFDGTVYGSVNFTPADATFSNAVDLTIPAGTATGTVNVYRWNGTSWSMVGTGTVSGGTVTISYSALGCFLVGEMHSQGGGGTL